MTAHAATGSRSPFLFPALALGLLALNFALLQSVAGGWWHNFALLFPTAFFTLGIYSFLGKDNAWFKFTEHVFAGLTAGYYFGLIFQTVVVQQLWTPFTQEGPWFSGPWEAILGRWILIVPAILGLLLFARFLPKGGWLTRLPLAFVMGNTAGVMFLQQLHGYILPHVHSTVMSVDPAAGFLSEPFVKGMLVAIGVVTTILYFYFSKPHTGPLGWVANAGIVFIMIAFGAHFGYTVMARVSLLIGRVQFLFVDWLQWAG